MIIGKKIWCFVREKLNMPRLICIITIRIVYIVIILIFIKIGFHCTVQKEKAILNSKCNCIP